MFPELYVTSQMSKKTTYLIYCHIKHQKWESFYNWEAGNRVSNSGWVTDDP